MAVKKCCIEKCKSCSTRKEDQGVTYHKFPKDPALRNSWVRVTHHTHKIELGTYVCSRHFCKKDFMMYQDTKYVLESGAVPSIFPWTKSKIKTKMDELDSIGVESGDDKNNLSSSSKDSEPENLEAIKKFIESHERTSTTKDVKNKDESAKPQTNESGEHKDENTEKIKQCKQEPVVTPTSVMNLTLSDTDNQFKPKKDVKPPEHSSTERESNSVSLSVGSKVEARDFSDSWYSAEIIEVDYDEMEVLVHYETESRRHDEWICVNSTRLRPITTKKAVPIESKPKVVPEVIKEEKTEIKAEEKSKLMYTVGERCLARWRDNRRFVATIQADLGNGEYKIIFDDGFQWKCTSTRLSKLKDKGKADPLSESRAIPSPELGAGPSTAFPVPSQMPIFHTHLFDPTRDYLGTKSERREMKRKLNIKEIFNIGQKQRKKDTPPKENKLKVMTDRKKPSILKRALKAEPKVEATKKKEVKRNIPEAVASIIGTIGNNDKDIKINKEIKLEVEHIVVNTEKVDPEAIEQDTETKDIFKEEKCISPHLENHGAVQTTRQICEDSNSQQTDTDDQTDVALNMDEDTQSAKVSDDEEMKEQDDLIKEYDDQIDLLNMDPVLKEECELQNFEKPDDKKHEEVIDRIKEVINKLEDGLNRMQRVDSPKTVVKEVPKPEAVTTKEPTTIEAEEVKTVKSKEPVTKESEEPKTMKSEDSKTMQSEGPKTMELEEAKTMDFEEAKSMEFEEAKSIEFEEPTTLESETSPFPLVTHQEPVHSIDLKRLEIKIEKLQELKSFQSANSTALTPPEPSVPESMDKESLKTEEPKPLEAAETASKSHRRADRSKKSLSKIKKNKKLRLIKEKNKVRHQVEKVKCELEAMKKQMEEIRKQMLLKTEALAVRQEELPESCLMPDEWCCRWLNGTPVGTVVESGVELDPFKQQLPRCTVKVEDRRLPEGWSKLMVRRSLGYSAGKWDVCLVSPDNKKHYTKTDMRNYLESNPNPALKPYEHVLFDFGAHIKLSRRMGWVKQDGTVKNVSANSPMPFLSSRKFGIKRSNDKRAKRRKISSQRYIEQGPSDQSSLEASSSHNNSSHPALEDGYVYVGSLKVQVIDNLLRCPAEDCLKNFRNNTLLQMHIKHYHRELRIMLGATPKVLDLAYARTRPVSLKTKMRYQRDSKIIKVKIPRPPKRNEEKKPEVKDVPEQVREIIPQVKPLGEKVPRSLDSPLMRQLAANRPVKRPKVLLPVRRPEPVDPPEVMEEVPDFGFDDSQLSADIAIPPMDIHLDPGISEHMVNKTEDGTKRVPQGKFATLSKAPTSEDEEVLTMNSDLDSQSSFPGSTTPDSKPESKGFVQNMPALPEAHEDQKDSGSYIYTETGERIKIERMKAEEIINCHCGYREEDGLMVQCELCLCWQHALCHNIQRETDVPERYTCSICVHPWRGRRSRRHLHEQERLRAGRLPGGAPDAALRRSHRLSAALLRVADALHALRVKYHAATKKNHPKLYLWAKDWEDPEMTFGQEKASTEYSDLNLMMNNIGKQNRAVKVEELNPPETERLYQREGSLGSHSLLSGLLSSPVGPSLDMPISTTELEKLAKSVQDEEWQRASGPQPEAAIENGACRERLLRHLQRCQTLLDARLDTIDADIVELEAQNPSFEDDETADYFPRTKQTIQMLMRDLETMEELGMMT